MWKGANHIQSQYIMAIFSLGWVCASELLKRNISSLLVSSTSTHIEVVIKVPVSKTLTWSSFFFNNDTIYSSFVFMSWNNPELCYRLIKFCEIQTIFVDETKTKTRTTHSFAIYSFAIMRCLWWCIISEGMARIKMPEFPCPKRTMEMIIWWT